MTTLLFSRCLKSFIDWLINWVNQRALTIKFGQLSIVHFDGLNWLLINWFDWRVGERSMIYLSSWTGKVRLQLESNGRVVVVDEDEVVKANPPQFDQAEDLANLRHLNESSVLHTIRQRYASSLPHTYAGQSLIVVNPVSPLAVYSERVFNALATS